LLRTVGERGLQVFAEALAGLVEPKRHAELQKAIDAFVATLPLPPFRPSAGRSGSLATGVLVAASPAATWSHVHGARNAQRA
jgi:hypothetical protein